jgi:hypothetical protein
MILTYQYSIITPCYCKASKMFSKNIEIQKIKMDNSSNNITGCIIERRFEKDEHDREHIKSINHCPDCNRNWEQSLELCQPSER